MQTMRMVHREMLKRCTCLDLIDTCPVQSWRTVCSDYHEITVCAELKTGRDDALVHISVEVHDDVDGRNKDLCCYEDDDCDFGN